MNNIISYDEFISKRNYHFDKKKYKVSRLIDHKIADSIKKKNNKIRIRIYKKYINLADEKITPFNKIKIFVVKKKKYGPNKYVTITHDSLNSLINLYKENGYTIKNYIKYIPIDETVKTKSFYWKKGENFYFPNYNKKIIYKAYLIIKL